MVEQWSSLLRRSSFGYEGRIGVLKMKGFELRVPGCGSKDCRQNSAVRDPQLVTRNTQRKNEPNTPLLQYSNTLVFNISQIKAFIQLTDQA
jgi:hypothetical protein